jgi:sugar phosphate isomerase/epimerase
LIFIAETLKKVAAAGYTAVQISGFGPVDPVEVGKLAEDNGLKIATSHISWTRFLEELDQLRNLALDGCAQLTDLQRQSLELEL